MHLILGSKCFHILVCLCFDDVIFVKSLFQNQAYSNNPSLQFVLSFINNRMSSPNDVKVIPSVPIS